MRIFEQIERINRLDDLISKKKTGRPEQLARKLKISESRLYQIIEELKSYDIPIAYSRSIQSYHYSYEYEMRIITSLGPKNRDTGTKQNRHS